jgi:ppGpp synthetase/RelA/SpoT-type nucleotidyltranferase
MSSLLPSPDALAKTWDERPDIIRAFIEIRPQYEQLCREIEYILKKKMDEAAIEYSAITSRAKTLKSFAEKISRKNYDAPLKDITDLAGVRLVYLYKSDRPVIEQIIESEFKIIEKVDKVEEQESDKFGYGALHYLVHLGRKSSGARYDDLKGMICELQVRTVLQDAWAIIDHHLIYKQESDVPKILKRKINSVAGLFETADDQFDRIRTEREIYKESVKSKLGDEETFLKQETNLDTFTEFLKWRLPNLKVKDSENISKALKAAEIYGYKTLSEMDTLLKRTEKARRAMSDEKKSGFAEAEFARAIALERPAYRTGSWADETRALFEKYADLLSS